MPTTEQTRRSGIPACIHGRPERALTTQLGGAGSAHGQAAHEDRGRFPHAGRGRVLRTNAGEVMDTPRKQDRSILDALPQASNAPVLQPGARNFLQLMASTMI